MGRTYRLEMRRDHPVVRPAMGRGLIHRGTRGASGAACSDDEQCGNTSLSKTLLPPTAADLRHLLDRAIPRARPWSPSRHTCRFVWGHHDGRAPCRGRIVERDCVVDRDAGAVGVERRDQAAAGCRVICRRLRPRVGHDILRGGSARWCLCPPATRTAFPCIVQDLECPPGERHAVIPLRQLRRPSMCSRRSFAAAHSPCLSRPPERMWTDAACPRPPPQGGTESMTPHETGSTTTPRRNRVHDPARDRLDHHPR